MWYLAPLSHNPLSLDALFSPALRGLCCSTSHRKRQAAHHQLHCILDVFETSWAASVHPVHSFGHGSPTRVYISHDSFVKIDQCV